MVELSKKKAAEKFFGHSMKISPSPIAIEGEQIQHMNMFTSQAGDSPEFRSSPLGVQRQSPEFSSGKAADLDDIRENLRWSPAPAGSDFSPALDGRPRTPTMPELEKPSNG